MQVERVGQDDALERFVSSLIVAPAMKRLFDVYGRNVIGEQHDLIGMQLPAVLSQEIRFRSSWAIRLGQQNRKMLRTRIRTLIILKWSNVLLIPTLGSL